MSGVLLAVVAKGTQDKWIEDASSINLFDAHKQLLKSKYQVVYTQLPTKTPKWCNKNKILSMTMIISCDLINEVDLVLFNPYKLPLNDILSSIELHFGDYCIDRILSDDVQTQILTNCDLWNRKMSHVKDTTFIPLTIAPLHPNNLAFPSTLHHEMTISVTFKEKYTQSVGENVSKHVSLYGNMYMVEPSARRILFEEGHTIVTIQNQYTGAEILHYGVNSFKIHYNHPVTLLYFWGCDISKIKNVKLLLNNAPFYDGPVEPLIHKQRQRGVSTDVVVMYFTNDDLTSCTNSSINFSRIDDSKLVIDTHEEEESLIYVVGLNMQPLRYMSGMVGLVFSK